MIPQASALLHLRLQTCNNNSAFALDSIKEEENSDCYSSGGSPYQGKLDSHYHTSFGDISSVEAKRTVNALIENPFQHSIYIGRTDDRLNTDIKRSENLSSTFTSMLSQYGPDKFAGFLIDTGAARHSSVGAPQMVALQKLSPNIIIYELNPFEEWTVHFGIGESTSEQRATISTAIGQITFYIFDTTTPFLICLADLKRCGFYLNNLENTLNNANGSIKIPIAVQ